MAMAKQFFCVVLAGGALALGMFTVGRTERVVASTQPAVSRPGVERRSPRPVGCDFHPDERLRYRITSRSEVTLSSAGGAGSGRGDSRNELRTFAGELTLRAVMDEPAQPDGRRTTVLAAAFEHAIVITSNHEDYALAHALATPILIRMDDECRIRELAVPDAVGASAHNHWVLLLKQLELVLEAPGTAARWNVRQSDTAGVYVGTYGRVERGQQEVEVRRTRGGYHQLHRPEVGIHVHASTAVARYVPQRAWFQNLRVDEHVSMTTSGVAVAEVRTTVTASGLDAADGGALGETPALVGARFEPANVLEQDTATALPYVNRPLLAGLELHDTGSVLAEVSARLVQAPPNYDAALQLLVQYLRLDPAHGRELLERIRARTVPSDTRSVLFLGLQLAGGPAIHAMLAAVVEDSAFAHLDRLRAIHALGSVPDPDHETLQALLRWQNRPGFGSEDEDVRSGASLALGTLARHPELSAEARQTILGRLATDLQYGRSPREIVSALGAAGNAGATSLADAVLARTNDPDPAIAAEAYRTLGKIGALPPAGTLLDRWLAQPAPPIKEAVARALLQHPLDTSSLARCIALLDQQRLADERMLLVRLIGASVAHDSDARAALVDAFDTETDAAILAEIGRYLRLEDVL